MKNILPIAVLLLMVSVCYAQKAEISIQASSGLASYGGRSATSRPIVLINDTAPYYNVSSPYSKKSSFSYGFAIQVQKVSAKNLISGFRLGFDHLSTISHFDSYTAMGGTVSIEEGTVKLQNKLLQANPYLGYRLPVKNVHLDLTAGLNAGLILKSEYEVSHEGLFNLFDTKPEKNFVNTKIDLGPAVGLTATCKRIGFNASYYYGLINYTRNLDHFPNGQVYARYLRLGISYRIK